MKNVSEEGINAWTGSGFGLDLLDTQEDGPTSAGSAITFLAASGSCSSPGFSTEGMGIPGGNSLPPPLDWLFSLPLPIWAMRCENWQVTFQHFPRAVKQSILIA